jgi:aspartate racemase
MTTVGLVGGLGPESTIDYYRRILAAWERHDPSTAPSIVIDSLDAKRALRLVHHDRAAFVSYLSASVQRLARAGAGFVAMTANTAHLVYDEIASASPVPMISIVETCAAAARERGMRRLLLLGTRFTMEAPFYAQVCARLGIDVVTPGDAERVWLHERYVSELLDGRFLDETRESVAELAARLGTAHAVDGVILGGTELPLLLPGRHVAGIPALDTTELHVEAIVARLRAAAPPAGAARHAAP